MLTVKSQHRHKMVEAEPVIVQLKDGHGILKRLWDIFYRKECKCGHSETYRCERVTTKPNPQATKDEEK